MVLVTAVSPFFNDRRAWPRQQVIDCIRDQSGALFDPRVVEAFLDVAPYRTLAAT